MAEVERVAAETEAEGWAVVERAAVARVEVETGAGAQAAEATAASSSLLDECLLWTFEPSFGRPSSRLEPRRRPRRSLDGAGSWSSRRRWPNSAGPS